MTKTLEPSIEIPDIEMPNFEDVVCDNAGQFAKLLGVEERTVGYWKAKGMPYTKGNPAPIPVGPALRWLRENKLMGKASLPHQSATAATGGAPDGSPSAKHLNALFAQFDAAIEGGNWSKAIHFLLVDIDLFLGRAATLDEIINELEDYRPCTGGSVAIRLRGTRVYVWAGLQRDFADAFVGLVNLGMLQARADDRPSENPGDDYPWAKWLDLPLVEDLQKPSKRDCRVDLAFAAKVDGAFPVQLEAVAKPNLQVIDRADRQARENALQAIGHFDGLQSPEDRKAWLDRVEGELRKARKAARA